MTQETISENKKINSNDEKKIKCGSIYFDIVDACNLFCKTCGRGQQIMKNSSKYISFENFKKALDIFKQNNIMYIGFFNWTEPFLHPNIDQLMKYAKENGFFVMLSSNLSLPKINTLIPTLKYVDFLMISVSGFTQKMHETNHVGSKIDDVKRNIELIVKAKKNCEINTNVQVKYLKFSYNNDEIEDFEEYVKSFQCLEFVTLQASGNPLEQPELLSLDAYNQRMIDEFQANYDTKTQINTDTCWFVSNNIPIDHEGNAHLCCNFLNTPFIKIGNIFNDDIVELQQRRQNHPYCQICKRRMPEA